MAAKTVFSVSRLAITTFTVCGLLWFFGFLGLTNPLIKLTQRSLQPLQQKLTVGLIAVKLRIWQLSELYSAEQTVTTLRKERAALLSQLVTFQALQAENLALRKLIENSDRTLTKTTLATPIISFAQPALAINENAGVKPGMMLISHEQLLGFVARVNGSEAQVSLLQSLGTQAVLAKTQKGVVGLIQGDGQRIWLREVPPEQIVTEGEIVTTAGQAGVTPQLVIGTVLSVEKNPTRATQAILLQQPNNFFELSLVELR
jgi:rod shape-determining protein MreC